MLELRAAHLKMFGSKLAGNADDNPKPTHEPSGQSVPPPTATTNLTNQTNLEASSDSKCNVSAVCDGNSSSSLESFSNQANATPSSIASNGLPNDAAAVTNGKTIISPPPPLPPSLTSTLNTFGSACNAASNPDGKIRKLNTFGKLVAVQTNDNSNKLPANVLPKNNLNGLNQNETVKILRTSSPNKKKGPAPSPPISVCSAARNENAKATDKTAKIVRVNKKNEKITFLNDAGSPRAQNQIKLEGQRNGSAVDGADNKANYLSAKTDLSLSSLSIKVQAQ